VGDGLRGATVRAASWAVFDRWVGRLLSMGIFVLLGRLLLPRDFGLVALAAVVTSFLTVLIDQGFAEALVQAQTLSDVMIDTAFWTALCTGAAISTATALAAGFIATALGASELTPILRVLAMGFIFAALASTPEALLQRNLQFRALAYRRLLATVVGGAVGVSIAFGGGGAWSLVAQFLVQGGVGAATLWVATPWRPSFRFEREVFSQLFRFGIRVLGVDVLDFVNRQGDNLLVGTVLGATALGLYSVGYRVLLLVLELLSSTIGAVALPVFSRIQSDQLRLRRAYYMAARLSSAITVPAFAGLMLLAPRVVPLTFGRQWEGSVGVMQLLAPVGMINSVTYFDRSLLIAVGRPGVELRMTLLSALVNLGAFAVAVSHGVYWVAGSLLLTNLFFLWPVSIAVSHHYVGISPIVYLQQLIRPILGSAVMCAIIGGVDAAGWVSGFGWLDLASLVTVGVLAYCAALAVIGRDLLGEVLGLLTRRVTSAGDFAPGGS
jgi:O-antigen/teichoic acid export membrane protein